jgi:predicted phosphodiesterase
LAHIISILYNVTQVYDQKFPNDALQVYVTFGQHDLRYHNSDLGNTPLNVLIATDVICLLDKDPTEFNRIAFYGSGWGEEIPKITTKDFNVLVTHRMIINEEKIFDQQTEFEWANAFLLKNKFDLVISGDNHQFFVAQAGNKTLINCGSLMRSNIGQVNHKPSVVVFDTKTRKYEILRIPVKPWEEVMNFESAKEDKIRNEKLETFVKGLGESEEVGLDFVANLQKMIKDNKVDPEIALIIDECLGG